MNPLMISEHNAQFLQMCFFAFASTSREIYAVMRKKSALGQDALISLSGEYSQVAQNPS